MLTVEQFQSLKPGVVVEAFRPFQRLAPDEPLLFELVEVEDRETSILYKFKVTYFGIALWNYGAVVIKEDPAKGQSRVVWFENSRPSSAKVAPAGASIAEELDKMAALEFLDDDEAGIEIDETLMASLLKEEYDG